MDRNQAKQLLPIIQAYVEGKQIQHLYNEWKDIDVLDIDLAVNPELYRIKPELKYRPFANRKSAGQKCSNISRLDGIKIKTEIFSWFLPFQIKDCVVCKQCLRMVIPLLTDYRLV